MLRCLKNVKRDGSFVKFFRIYLCASFEAVSRQLGEKRI